MAKVSTVFNFNYVRKVSSKCGNENNCLLITKGGKVGKEQPVALRINKSECGAMACVKSRQKFVSYFDRLLWLKKIKFVEMQRACKPVFRGLVLNRMTESLYCEL